MEEAVHHIVAIFRAIGETPCTIRGLGPSRPPEKSDPKPDGRNQHKVRVTVSIGVASARTPDEVVADADAALYRAKAGGRNRIER